jgi:ATP-dependent Clp endopeptidase proteolytic subunit ClpP
MKTWFHMKAKADAPKAAEITIFDEIGFWGVTAGTFQKDLKALGDVEQIDVLVNSPGGSVVDGLAIYNMLSQHPATVNVKVMGIAASAASFIAMAGDSIEMPSNTFMMVHSPMSGVFGNADEMRDTADVLDKIEASILGIYAKRTGKSDEDLKALLKAETYMTAAEAVELGFATKVTDALEATASFDIDRLPVNVQAMFRKPAATPNTPLAEQIVARAKTAGLEQFGPTFALCETLDEADRVIAEAREIGALCRVMAIDDKRFEAFVNARKSLPEVRAAIAAERVAAAEQTIDTAPPTKPPVMSRGPLHTNAWAKALGVTLPTN